MPIMVEEKSHAGIQKLLQAEQEAAEMVAAAKAGEHLGLSIFPPLTMARPHCCCQ